jgi:hypothetical protein
MPTELETSPFTRAILITTFAILLYLAAFLPA